MNKLTNNSKKSDQDQSEPENASVFDFLYVDHQRINTFLSQFSEFGGLTNIVHGISAGRGKEDGGTVKAQGNVLVVKGEANYTETTKANHAESSQRTYDPQWANTLSFLDKIKDQNLLKYDIEKAAFGDLVLIQGPISVRDFSVLEQVWKLPAFRAMAEIGNAQDAGNRAERRRSMKAGGNKKAPPTEMDMFFDLINILPHPTQFKIGSSPSAWGILREEGMSTSSSDFVLKFGGSVPGKWAAVCILDAVPDEFEDNDGQPIGQLEEMASMILDPLEPIIRQLLGRPASSYGITPLAVFREVGR